MDLTEVLTHIQKATELLGEEFIILTVRHGIDARPTVALAEELLKLHQVTDYLILRTAVSESLDVLLVTPVHLV